MHEIIAVVQRSHVYDAGRNQPRAIDPKRHTRGWASSQGAGHGVCAVRQEPCAPQDRPAGGEELARSWHVNRDKQRPTAAHPDKSLMKRMLIQQRRKTRTNGVCPGLPGVAPTGFEPAVHSKPSSRSHQRQRSKEVRSNMQWCVVAPPRGWRRQPYLAGNSRGAKAETTNWEPRGRSSGRGGAPGCNRRESERIRPIHQGVEFQSTPKRSFHFRNGSQGMRIRKPPIHEIYSFE
jgi:hypothetical protein